MLSVCFRQSKREGSNARLSTSRHIRPGYFLPPLTVKRAVLMAVSNGNGCRPDITRDDKEINIGRLKMLMAISAFGLACVNAHAGELTQSGFSPLYLGMDSEVATV